MIYKVFAEEICRSMFIVEAESPQDARERVIRGESLDCLDSEPIGFNDNYDEWVVEEDE